MEMPQIQMNKVVMLRLKKLQLKVLVSSFCNFIFVCRNRLLNDFLLSVSTSLFFIYVNGKAMHEVNSFISVLNFSG